MIQPLTVQNARMPLVVIAALVLFALGGANVPRLSSNLSAVTDQEAIVAPLASSSESAIVQAETTTCGDGAYVTGDMVGDASPAAVYATLCGGQ